MSATILTERTLTQITSRLNDNVIEVMNLRYRPSSAATAPGGKDGATIAVGVVTAISAEEIGMRTAELNAYRRGMQDAADILRHEHQQLVAPDTPLPSAQANGEAREEKIEAVY